MFKRLTPTGENGLLNGIVLTTLVPISCTEAPDVKLREIAGLFVASVERTSFSVGTSAETSTTTPETSPTIIETAITTPETVEKTQENTQEKILLLLKQEPEITRNQLAKRLNITPDSVKHHLQKLKMAKRIEHVGPTKSGHWKILQ